MYGGYNLPCGSSFFLTIRCNGRSNAQITTKVISKLRFVEIIDEQTFRINKSGVTYVILFTDLSFGPNTGPRKNHVFTIWGGGEIEVVVLQFVRCVRDSLDVPINPTRSGISYVNNFVEDMCDLITRKKCVRHYTMTLNVSI